MNNFFIKDIVHAVKKEEGQEGCQSIRFDFLHNRQCFLNALKGILFRINYKNQFHRLGPKDVGVLFYMTFANKNSKVHFDVALLLMAAVCGVQRD
jgi:hypothetical protein